MNRWAIAVVVATLAVWGVVAAVHPDFNCNRWDNFEYFTPAIIQAHNLWLGGELPALNPHQLMGEPLIPSGQPGVFYFPYTLSVLLMHGLALPPEQLMSLAWILHLPLAALGYFCLLRTLGVRPAFAILTAVSVCFGGFVVSVSLGWIFMLAIFAWLPWILWGVTEVVSCGPSRGAGVMIALGMGAVGNVGYPQMTMYIWVLAILYWLVFGLWVFRAPRRLITAGGPLLAGVLLAAPTLIPMALAIPHTSRSEAFGLPWFLERGVPWKVLLGWFCPLVTATTDFLRDRSPILGYQGAWVVGALIAGVSALRIREQTGRVFVALVGLAALFTLFALGGNTFVYPLTYGLPVWSSFRWPFKFFLLSQALLALAAGVGLELGIQRWRRWNVIGVPLLVVIGLLATRSVNPWNSGLGWFSMVTALATLLLVGWSDRGWGRAALVVAGILSGVATLSQCHLSGLKTYRERYGEVGPDVLGIDTAYRVLPLTPASAPVDGEWQMQSLGLFHSATINGYFSATGTAAGLLPDWFATCLPCKVDGTLPYRYAQQMLPSHLLRTFNVKYVVAGTSDEIAQALVEEAGGYRLVHRLAHGLMYENRDALPRAYFATELQPFSFDALREGLLLNQAPATTAYADQWSRATSVAPGEVRRATFGQAEARFEVHASQGGFLVFSQRYEPGWRAWVDGQPVAVRAVNLTLLGVSVPVGAQTIVFRYFTPGLRTGAGLAVGGFVVLAGWLVSRTRTDSPRSAASSARGAPADCAGADGFRRRPPR